MVFQFRLRMARIRIDQLSLRCGGDFLPTTGPILRRSTFRPGSARVLARAAVVLVLLQPVSRALAQNAPASPDHPWHGLGEARIEADARNLAQPGLNLDPAKNYSLPELIDLAESHNPETRVAGERARAQAAAWGVARSELYPTVAAAALAGVDRDQAYLGQYEFQMASALHEEPYPVVALENGLQAPWGAEYILEGHVIPGVREPDGPYGEFTGHLSGLRNMVSVEITKVWHRKDPIYEYT